MTTVLDALVLFAFILVVLFAPARPPAEPIQPSAESFVVSPRWCLPFAMIGRACAIEPVPA